MIFDNNLCIVVHSNLSFTSKYPLIISAYDERLKDIDNGFDVDHALIYNESYHEQRVPN